MHIVTTMIYIIWVIIIIQFTQNKSNPITESFHRY